MTEETAELHMFYLCDCDYVVDTDIDAAWSAYSELTGYVREDDDQGRAIPDGAPLKVLVDDTGSPSDGGNYLTKTACEWALELGRGLAFSTEY